MKLKGISILVVDDEQDLRDTLMEIFETEGAQVVGAHDSQSAFALIQKQKFDIVISDMRMPGGGGLDLLQRIDSAIEVKPKLFLCTGYSDISPEKAKSLGVIEIFAKPFNLLYIISTIANSLG